MAYHYQFPHDSAVINASDFTHYTFAKICSPESIHWQQILGRMLEINQHLTQMQQQGLLYNLMIALWMEHYLSHKALKASLTLSKHILLH